MSSQAGCTAEAPHQILVLAILRLRVPSSNKANMKLAPSEGLCEAVTTTLPLQDLVYD